MSLRKFHIFFISVSGLLCLALLGWGIANFSMGDEGLPVGLAIVGVVGFALLFFYLRWFLKKYSKLAVYALSVITGTLLSGHSQIASACAVCYQDPNSPLTKAAITGVIFLLVAICGILASIFFVGRSWVKRARDHGIGF